MINTIYLRYSREGELRLLFPQAERFSVELEHKVMESLAPQLVEHGVYRFDLQTKKEGSSEIHQHRLAAGDDAVVLFRGRCLDSGEVELREVWLDLTGDEARQSEQEALLAQAVVEKLAVAPRNEWHWLLVSLTPSRQAEPQA